MLSFFLSIDKVFLDSYIYFCYFFNSLQENRRKKFPPDKQKMATFYDYYYVGNLNLTSEELHRSRPILLTFSKIQNGPKGEVPMHMHAHLEIFYFESGTGKFDFHGNIFSIQANDLLVVDAKQMHMQYSENQHVPLTYYGFAVNNMHLKGHNANCISNKGFFIHSFDSKKNLIYHNILQLLDELKERRYSYATKVDAIFREILVDILRLQPQTDDIENISESHLTNRKLLNDVKEYIEEHFAEGITVNDLIKVSFMNKSYFLHQFKKQFNISPMHYLNLVRIEQGKLLLGNTTRSITQIAADVGIGNPVYFTELFTKTVGVSPTMYRKIILGQSKYD